MGAGACRLPQARPTIKLPAKEVGLKADADVLQAQLNGSAFRLPAEFEVSWAGDAVAHLRRMPAGWAALQTAGQELRDRAAPAAVDRHDPRGA